MSAYHTNGRRSCPKQAAEAAVSGQRENKRFSIYNAALRTTESEYKGESKIDSIVLASKSPRRRELIEKIGISDYRVIETNIDETPPDNVKPWQQVCVTALKKARAAYKKCDEDDVIIAADTLVVVDGAVYGKPADEHEAFVMLNTLSGIWHEVVTGVVVKKGDRELVEYESTFVKFREMETDEMEKYVRREDTTGKAGAYGIQDTAALFVERIEGDYYNVVGLPLCKLGLMLASVGVELI